MRCVWGRGATTYIIKDVFFCLNIYLQIIIRSREMYQQLLVLWRRRRVVFRSSGGHRRTQKPILRVCPPTLREPVTREWGRRAAFQRIRTAPYCVISRPNIVISVDPTPVRTLSIVAHRLVVIGVKLVRRVRRNVPIGKTQPAR